MKKFFKYLGISIFLCASFFYTEKTSSVVKEMDKIMIEIREKAEQYKVEPIEAITTKETIIPGLSGKEIDINNSYKEMRYIGKYNEKFLKYKKIEVKEKLIDNLNKTIIGGNKNKKSVSLVFIVENNDNINNIIKILKSKNISATFLISGTWLEDNNHLLYSIASHKHSIGSIGYNYSYNNSSYTWVDSIIKRVTKEKNSFCIKVSDGSHKLCQKYNNYTLESKIIDSNAFINTKKTLDNGTILIYKINNSIEKELEYIISYINKKGLEIVNIKELLKE